MNDSLCYVQRISADTEADDRRVFVFVEEREQIQRAVFVVLACQQGPSAELCVKCLEDIIHCGGVHLIYD